MIDRRGAAVAAVLAIAGVLCLRPGYVIPDALATWSWLRSLLLDGDLLFFNEWGARGLIRDGYPFFKEITATGALANHWWIGSTWIALLPYAGAHALASASGGTLGAGGLGGVYVWTLSWLSLGCLWLVWLISDRITGGAKSVTALLLLTLGTPLFWYAFRFPTLSHLPGAAAVGLLVWCIWRSEREASPSLDLGIGISLGLAAAVRLQHALLLFAVIVALLLLRRPLAGWLRVAAGVMPFALLQGGAWFAIYGTPLGPLVRGVDPGGGTWAPFRNVALIDVLFAPWNGLFVWAPITLLAVVGWVGQARRGPGPSILPVTLIVMFVSQWIANGVLDRWWWGGAAFGPRRWVDLAVPFLIGLVWILQRWKPSLPLAVGSAVWSSLLIAAAVSGELDLDGPTGWSELLAGVGDIAWSSLPGELLAPAIPSGDAMLMCVVGLALVVAYAALLALLARRNLAVPCSMVTALALTIWIGAVTPATRERAGFFHQAFRLDPSRAGLGALLDRRYLLAKEVEWARIQGRADGVESGELAALDAEIARRSGL